MGKQISIVLEETTLEQLEALRAQLGLLEIQDVIRLLIPEGLKRYKEEKKKVA
jgi:hypothetical protein